MPGRWLEYLCPLLYVCLNLKIDRHINLFFFSKLRLARYQATRGKPLKLLSSPLSPQNTNLPAPHYKKCICNLKAGHAYWSRGKFCLCSLVNKVQLVPDSEIVGSARYRPPFPRDHALIFSRALHLRVVRLKRGRCKIKFPPERVTIKTLLLQYRCEVCRS